MFICRNKLVLLIVTVGLAVSFAQEEPQVTDIFISGQDGYAVYRIPALITTMDGTLLALCEGRKNSSDDEGDIDLVMKRSEDNGQTWSALELVYETGGTAAITIGNPCPVIDRTNGKIHLPFCEDNDKVFIISSDDDGNTWSAPSEITSDVKDSSWGWYATGPGVGIQLKYGPKAGRLIIPCDHGYDGHQYSHVFYSDDNGASWTLGGTVGADTDECQVVELTDGRLMINMRNYGQPAMMRAVAYSDDYGETWGDISYDATLVEEACQASMIRMTWPEDGKSRILFSNPADDWNRIRMTVRVSYDEGDTWAVSKIVNDGASAYSCLSLLADNTIGLLFENGNSLYDRIVFYKFSLKWLTGGNDSMAVDSGLVLTPQKSRIALDGNTSLSVALVGGLTGSVTWSVDDGGTLSEESDSGAVFNSDGTEGTFTVTAEVGDRSESVNIEVYDPTKYSVQINCGGGAVDNWVGDAGFVSGGESYNWEESIDVSGVENAGPAQIYETVRHTSPHSYTFPVVDGDYIVRIHFVDRMTSLHRDVTYNIEGTAVESGISIPEGPEVREYNVTVSDGNGLTIECIGNGESDVFEAGIEVTYDGGSATEAYKSGFGSGIDGLRVYKISGGRYRISALSGKEPFSARIVSVNGTVVESFSGRGSGIWNPECASGLYFIDVVSGDRRFRERVLIQR